MWKEQKRILDRFYKNYGHFGVAAKTIYWKHMTYPSSEAIDWLKAGKITDRKIMKDEIIIESDLPMRKMNKGVAEKIEKKLRKNNMSYEKWFSGNKSYHIHTNFPELVLMRNSNDLKLLKRCFLLWIYSFDEQSLGKHKIDLQLTGNVMIRMEYSFHPITGQVKELYAEHEVDESNTLPASVWLKYLEQKKVIYISDGNKSVFEKECIMFFYKTPVADARHRIAFILFNQFKREFGVDKASKVLKEWNLNTQNNHIQEKEIEYIIKYHSKHNKSPGCRYIKDVLIDLGVSDRICRNCVG